MNWYKPEMERDQFKGLSSIKNIASQFYIGNTFKLREHLVKYLVLSYV